MRDEAADYQNVLAGPAELKCAAIWLARISSLLAIQQAQKFVGCKVGRGGGPAGHMQWYIASLITHGHPVDSDTSSIAVRKYWFLLQAGTSDAAYGNLWI
ncbi:MAG TPA: hypothetical protein VKX49_20940 [Bryobacteraceae bacterium]|nr:hypothetical protein [Bryobacteraceae bacterium]